MKTHTRLTMVKVVRKTKEEENKGKKAKVDSKATIDSGIDFLPGLVVTWTLGRWYEVLALG